MDDVSPWRCIPLPDVCLNSKHHDLRNRNLISTDLLRLSCFRTKFHWWYIGWLSRELDAEIVVVPHPFGPTINHEDIIPPLVKIYTDFMEAADGRETIIAGDR